MTYDCHRVTINGLVFRKVKSPENRIFHDFPWEQRWESPMLFRDNRGENRAQEVPFFSELTVSETVIFAAQLEAGSWDLGGVLLVVRIHQQQMVFLNEI